MQLGAGSVGTIGSVGRARERAVPGFGCWEALRARGDPQNPGKLETRTDVIKVCSSSTRGRSSADGDGVEWVQKRSGALRALFESPKKSPRLFFPG